MILKSLKCSDEDDAQKFKYDKTFSSIFLSLLASFSIFITMPFVTLLLLVISVIPSLLFIFLPITIRVFR